MQQRMFRKAAIGLAVAALAGCTDKATPGNQSPPNPPPAGEAVGYVINAVTDSPNLSVTYTDSAGTKSSNADLALGGVLKVAPPAFGTSSLEADELLASDNSNPTATPPVITQPLITTASTVKSFDVTAQFITGTHASPQVITVTANGTSAGYGLGYADVVLADAAPLAAAAFPSGVEYYLTDPTGTQVIFPPTSVTFGVSIDPFVLQGAKGLLPTFTSYRLFVVDATNPTSILFDSGTTVLQPPSGGALILGLIDNGNYAPAFGNSPFQLFQSISGKVTSNQHPLESTVRVVNGTNLGGVDLTISNTTPVFSGLTNVVASTAQAACGIGISDTLLANAVTNPTPSPTAVDFAPTGSGTPNASLELANFSLSDADLLLLPVGASTATAGTATALQTLVFNNDSRSVTTEARLRFVNLSTATVVTGTNATGTVLVYVSPTGTVLDTDIQAGTVTPNGTVDYGVDPSVALPFADVAGTNQAFVSIAGNAGYDIRVASDNGDGTQTIITEATNVTFPKGASVTEVLVDGTPQSLTSVDNTAAACP